VAQSSAVDSPAVTRLWIGALAAGRVGDAGGHPLAAGVDGQCGLLPPSIRSQPRSRRAFLPCFAGVCGWVVCAKNWQLLRGFHQPAPHRRGGARADPCRASRAAGGRSCSGPGGRPFQEAAHRGRGARSGSLHTDLAERLVDQPGKEVGVFGALASGRGGLTGLVRGGPGIVGPPDMEHAAEQHERAQQELVKAQGRYHDDVPLPDGERRLLYRMDSRWNYPLPRGTQHSRMRSMARIPRTARRNSSSIRSSIVGCLLAFSAGSAIEFMSSC